MRELQRYLFSPDGILIILVLITYIRARRNASIVSRSLKQGGVYIDNVSIPAREYYEQIAQRIAPRNIEQLRMRTTTLPENSPLMASREYLKIERDSMQFYVCTFELGTSQVFTYWQIAPLEFWHHLLSSIPLIGRIIRALFFPVTLYKIDVSSALLGMIEGDIKATTGELGTEKGRRELEQADLQRIKQIFRG